MIICSRFYFYNFFEYNIVFKDYFGILLVSVDLFLYFLKYYQDGYFIYLMNLLKKIISYEVCSFQEGFLQENNWFRKN